LSGSAKRPPLTKIKKKRTSVQLDPEMRMRLREIAARADVPTSSVLRWMLMRGMSEYEKDGILVPREKTRL
jgi:predicted DNA-binding protein